VVTSPARETGLGKIAASRGVAGIAGAGMSAVDRLAIIYLALPVAIFFFTWFKPLYGVPLAAAALAGIPFLFPLKFGPSSDRSWLIAAVVATGWTLLGGAGHFFFADYFDWHMRDAVLRDLVMLPAPVTYTVQDGMATILRAPIAYYMVPALLGRIAGLRNADWFLFLWTLAGVFLFLMQVMAGERRWKALALIATVVVLFSGMDILMSTLAPVFQAGSDRLSWPYPFFMYRSNTTSLFWGPTHALPAWLTIALIYRCWKDRRFVSLAAWVGALTLLWSPLVSIGLLPFFLALATRALFAGNWRPLLSVCNLVAAPLIALVAALYLTAAAGTIHAAGADPYSWLDKAVLYAKFIPAEFLLLALALLRAHRDGIQPLFFAVAVAVLLLLPFFHFGPNNDLSLYASIPALAAIMFAVVDGWARPLRIGGPGILVTVILVLGALAPLSELYRSASWPSWKPDLQRSVVDASGGQSPNYLLRLDPDMSLMRLLRGFPQP